MENIFTNDRLSRNQEHFILCFTDPIAFMMSMEALE